VVRVEGRGYSLTINRNPSPGSHRCDPTSPARGEVQQAAAKTNAIKSTPL
jgi:hypothetical protein